MFKKVYYLLIIIIILIVIPFNISSQGDSINDSKIKEIEKIQYELLESNIDDFYGRIDKNFNTPATLYGTPLLKNEDHKDYKEVITQLKI